MRKKHAFKPVPGKLQYEATKGQIITFENYQLPEHAGLDEFKADEFRYNGFDLVPWKNSIMQYGYYCKEEDTDPSLIELIYRNNVAIYGHPVGAVNVPNIIKYNPAKKCYYGLCSYNDNITENLEYHPADHDYILECEPYFYNAKLLKYDEFGHLISVRTVSFTTSTPHQVDLQNYTCGKALVPFIEEMYTEYREHYASLYVERHERFKEKYRELRKQPRPRRRHFKSRDFSKVEELDF